MNGSKEKNGIVPIMGRVTINGTVAQFSCKQSIPKTLWDVKGNRAKGKSAEVRDINLALDNIKAQIIKHYLRIFDREAFVTAEMVSNAYQGIGSEYETLLKASGRETKYSRSVSERQGNGNHRSRVVARTMWQRSSMSFTDGRICSCWRLSPTSSRGLQPTYQRKRDFTTGRYGKNACG